MSNRNLLSFGKKFFIVVGVLTGILLILLLLSYVTEPEIKVKNIKITNLTDSSATISWISDTPSVGSVLVSEDNKFDILTNFRKVRFYDDRDTGDYNWILNTQAQDRYTHHVTITNLSPESKYYYRIAGAYRTVETTYPLLETLEVTESLKTPDPMYGTFLKNADPDSVIYVTLNGGLELSTYMNDSSSFSLDKTNARVNYNTGDTINLKLYTKDAYVEYEGKVGFDQPLDLTTPKDLGVLTSQVKGLTSSLVGEVNAACQCGAGTVACGGFICANGGYYKCESENSFKYQSACTSTTPPVTSPTTPTPAVVKCGNMSVNQTLCNPQDRFTYTCKNVGGVGQLEKGAACTVPAPYSPEGSNNVASADAIKEACKDLSGGAGAYCGPNNTLYSCKLDGTGSVLQQCGTGMTCKPSAPGTADKCVASTTVTSTTPVISPANQNAVNVFCNAKQPQSGTQCFDSNLLVNCIGSGTGGSVTRDCSKEGNKECKVNTCIDKPATVPVNECTGKPVGTFCYSDGKTRYTCTSNNLVTSPYDCTKISGQVCENNGCKVPTPKPASDACSTKMEGYVCSKNFSLLCEDYKTKAVRELCTNGCNSATGLCNGITAVVPPIAAVPIVQDLCDGQYDGKYCSDEDLYYICSGGKLIKSEDCKSKNMLCYSLTDGDEGTPPGCFTPLGQLPMKNNIISSINAQSVLGTTSGKDEVNVQVNDTGKYRVKEVSGYEVVGDSTVKVVVPDSAGNLGIKFFLDTNEDGIKDVGEEYVTEPLEVKLEKVSDLEVLKLKVGWNLIGNTMVIDGVESAKDLLNKINGAGGYATHVSTYRNGKWMIYSLRAGTELGKNFNLIPGEGYFVRVHKAVDLTLEGKKLASGSNYYLSTGWNLISLVPPVGMRATGLIDKINKSSVLESDVVTRYSSGRYENVVKDGTSTYGQDFNLSSLEGYFVRLKKGGVVFEL